jgi:hypothetical protein
MIMAFMLHDEGEEYLLQVAFSEEQSAPANFYIGLCDDTLVEADGLADILNELSGNGYARQTVASDDTDCVIAIDGDYYKCTFAEQTFTASGGNWDEVNTWFIGTTSDNAGKLIASGPIDPARTLSDGDSMDVEIYIRVK